MKTETKHMIMVIAAVVTAATQARADSGEVWTPQMDAAQGLWDHCLFNKIDELVVQPSKTIANAQNQRLIDEAIIQETYNSCRRYENGVKSLLPHNRKYWRQSREEVITPHLRDHIALERERLMKGQ
jgi:hypothetical protein